MVTVDDNDQGDGGSQNVSSVLTAGRDPFFSAASFNFSAVRFRMRGYDGDNNTTYMNGIPMDNLDNGLYTIMCKTCENQQLFFIFFFDNINLCIILQ